jgi:hypothetical protein
MDRIYNSLLQNLVDIWEYKNQNCLQCELKCDIERLLVIYCLNSQRHHISRRLASFKINRACKPHIYDQSFLSLWRGNAERWLGGGGGDLLLTILVSKQLNPDSLDKKEKSAQNSLLLVRYFFLSCKLVIEFAGFYSTKQFCWRKKKIKVIIRQDFLSLCLVTGPDLLLVQPCYRP